MYNDNDERKDDPYFVKWAKQVKIRDDFTCQICGRRGVLLHAHHKNSWDWFEKGRYIITNGVTLCQECHYTFHDIYGYGQNIEDQYYEFEKLMNSLNNAYDRLVDINKAKKLVLVNIAIETDFPDQKQVESR